jgi:hypothetical protein
LVPSSIAELVIRDPADHWFVHRNRSVRRSVDELQLHIRRIRWREPAFFIIISLFLIMAWRVAGRYGLDRVVLPKLGTPWQPGTIFRRKQPASAPAET